MAYANRRDGQLHPRAQVSNEKALDRARSASVSPAPRRRVRGPRHTTRVAGFLWKVKSGRAEVAIEVLTCAYD